MLELYNKLVDTTVIQVRNHLYSIFHYAKKDGIIEDNPFEEDRINFPRAPQKNRKDNYKGK